MTEASPRQAPLLVLKDVRKSFREPDGQVLPILNVADFRLARGEQAVLVGPSGCGKTTLLHVIAGIRRADSGRILFHGVDLLRLSEAGRDRFRAANIGYVFQTFNLLPAFTALENVLLGMTFSRRRRDERRARQLLDRVGLGHRLGHTSPRRCRWASSSGWPWPGPWRTGRGCCWPTSRRPTWTRATSSRLST